MLQEVATDVMLSEAKHLSAGWCSIIAQAFERKKPSCLTKDSSLALRVTMILVSFICGMHREGKPFSAP